MGRLAVQAVLEDVAYAVVGGCADRQGPGAGVFQPLGRVLARQSHQPQAGAVALFGVRPVCHLPGHHGGGAYADALRPGDELGGRPLQVCTVRGGHVLAQGGVGPAPLAQGVTGHALVGGKALHQGVGGAHIQAGADQPVRHAVVVAFEFDVVVDVDLDALPAADDVPGGGQGLQGRGVQLVKGTAPAAWQLLEWTMVEVDQQSGNGVIEFAQAEELAVAQARQDPAFDQEHGTFDLGLVPGVRRTGGQQRAAVVLGKLLVAAVGLGVVSVGVLDQGASLVGHDQTRHTAQELKGADLGANPVGGGLARRGTGKGVVRRPQRGHEDLRRTDLARGRIDDGHGLTGVVHKQLLTGHMALAHRALEALREQAVFDAKAGVLVGLLIATGVLLPQQHQGDAGTLELLVNVREVGRQLVAGARQGWSVQPGLKFLVAERLGYRPVDAGHAGQRHVLADNALGQFERAGNLVVAEVGLQVQAQCLSDLAHRDSDCWHRLGPHKAASMRPGQRSLARTRIVHDGAETPSTINLKCRPPSD